MAAADITLGFLVYIDDTLLFFVASLALRVFASFGRGALLTARNAIIAKEFSENAGYTFAILEIFIGFGLMVGPTAGGILFEYGGFILPFIVLGSVEFLAGVVSAIFLPNYDFITEEEKSDSSISRLLQNPKIIFFCLGVLAASISRGFNEVALASHLSYLNLTPIMIGSMFMLGGGTFTLSSPILGFLCDKVMSPMYVVLISAACGCIGFLLLGPVPFIPLNSTLTLCIISLPLLGIAGCGEIVGGYSGSIRAALEEGLSDNIVTYGLVSGLWSTAFYLGEFLGPTITGVMIDNYGFGWSSTVILSLHFLVVLIIIFYLLYCLMCKRTKDSNTKFDNYGIIKESSASIENYDAGSLQLLV